MAYSFVSCLLALAAITAVTQATGEADPLGMESGAIPDSSITATSSYLAVFAPSKARLNQASTWCPRVNANQWIQVDLLQPYRITAVATQGRYNYNQWVKSYKVGCSIDGVNFNQLDKTFTGNVDRNSVVKNNLPDSQICRFVRLTPVTVQSNGCLRMELYGTGPARSTVDVSLPLGMQNEAILDSKITASSSYNAAIDTSKARLNDAAGWCSRTQDANQWIQVDLSSPYRITAIATQGRGNVNHWVKTYKIACSVDGVNFNVVQTTDTNPATDKIFNGNVERYSVVMNVLPKPQVCRFVRLIPVTWQAISCLRLELYGVGPLEGTADVSLPLGMQNEAILDSKITASSSYTAATDTSKARLNDAAGWCSRARDNNQWIQMDLSNPYRITAIATQGRGNANYYVKTYKIACSVDGINFNIVQTTDTSPATDKIFNGNIEHVSVVMNVLTKPQVCRFVRLIPVTWQGLICLRLELYGVGPLKASVDVSLPLGVENGTIIKDTQLSASTEYMSALAARDGRLNDPTGWCPRVNDGSQWIQVDLADEYIITAVATQGRKSAPQWVTSYKLQCSNNGADFQTIQNQETGPATDKIFEANIDQYSVVMNILPKPQFCRYVRLVPVAWNGFGCLRMEIYGQGPVTVQPLTNKISDSNIRASSEWSTDLGTSQSRLNSAAGWCARNSNANQWIQVDLLTPFLVTAVATKARVNHNQWVATYKIGCSLDGVTFDIIKTSDGSDKVFTGNVDNTHVVKNDFPKSRVCRFVRLIPVTWQDAICFRMEVYGKRTVVPNVRVSVPLGLENDVIPDTSITASSTHSPLLGTSKARLNDQHGWCVKTRDVNQWVQVDLLKPYRVTAVETQGRGDYSQWVKSYKMACSMDGVNFDIIQTNDSSPEDKIFDGNVDRFSVVINVLPKSRVCRFVRLMPLTWHEWACLRMEIYGVGPITDIEANWPVSLPLGMESDTIPDSSITASSEYNAYLDAPDGRLNQHPGWCASTISANQWIQVDLTNRYRITAVATQGRALGYWVISYKIACSTDGVDFNIVQTRDRSPMMDMTFIGNIDRYSVVMNVLPRPQLCRYVRLLPVTSQYRPCLRMELYGTGPVSEKRENDDMDMYYERDFENEEREDDWLFDNMEDREERVSDEELFDLNNQQRNYEQDSNEGLEEREVETMEGEYGADMESEEKRNLLLYLMELLE